MANFAHEPVSQTELSFSVTQPRAAQSKVSPRFPMRIGISVQSSYRVSDPAEGVRYMLERAEAANQADLDSLLWEITSDRLPLLSELSHPWSYARALAR